MEDHGALFFGACCGMLRGWRNKEVMRKEECYESSFRPSLAKVKEIFLLMK